MVQVIVSRETAAQIMGLTEPCDVCDEDGRLVGRVTPQRCCESSDENLVIPFSEEEVEESFKGPGVPFEQVMQRLRQLELQTRLKG